MYNKSIKEFNDLLFSKEAVPGGGSTSALVGALSSCLGNMAIELTYGKKKYLEYEEQLKELSAQLKLLDDKLLQSINDDAKAFYPLSKAYSMDKNNPEYIMILERCLQDACMPPLSIMKYCAKVIEIDNMLKDITSKIMISDVGTSLALATGALKGAYLNVLVNTKLMKDKEYAGNLENMAKKILDKYSKIADEAYSVVLGRL